MGERGERSELLMHTARYAPPAPAADDGTGLSKAARAAWYVEDAFEGDFCKEPKTAEQRKLYIAYENMVHPERLLCVLLLALISFIEIPLWCLAQRAGDFAWENGHHICRAQGHVYLSGTDYLPLGVTLVAEFLAVSYLAMLAGMELGFGKKRDVRFGVRVWATGLLACDVVLFGFCVVAFGRVPGFRLAPYLRVALMVVNVQVIWEAAEAVACLLGSFLDITFLLTLVVAFFGWLAAITLDDYDMDNRQGVAVNTGFDGLGVGIYTMFFVATTADFPDQMIPSYVYARSFGVFFFVYVLIAVFLFVELILAVVYNDYADHVKERLVTTNTKRVAGLKEAFDLLAEAPEGGGEPHVSRKAFEALVAETNLVEKVPSVRKDEVDFFFSIMDDDRSGSISKAEFFDVCDILQYSFRKVRTTTWCERKRPDWARAPLYGEVKAFVTSPAFDLWSTAVLIVNTLAVLVESYYDLADTLTPAGEEAFAVIEVMFSFVYMGLLCAALLVTPLDEYVLSAANRFDATVTIVLFAVAVFWALPGTHVSRHTLHMLTILRLTRLLTSLNHVGRFKLIVTSIVKMVPASAGVIGILYCAGAAWSALGVQLLGGLVYEGNPKLEDTDYLDAGYDVLNFNDFSMGFMSLFAYVTAGPFHEFIEAAEAVALPGTGYVFFITFYIVGVLIIFNVFSAFVIDAFLSQWEDSRALAEDAEVETLDQSNVAEGYRIVATRRANKDDVYKAMFLEGDD